MALGKGAVLELVKGTLFPAFKAERDRLDRVDRWYRWDHDKPHTPNSANNEYKELRDRAQTPWLGLVVTAVAQTLYVEGYRRATDEDNATAWSYWQANGMDARQIPVHRAGLAYGLAYLTVLPGETDRGEPIPVMRGVSPRRMTAFYLDPAEDDWPAYALRADPAKVKGGKGWKLRVYDDELVHTIYAGADGDGLEWITYDEHNVGVCPVVRFSNMLDLEGRADGEVEPFISIAGRIDQTTFDRLIVQRFASWVVRTISGMAPPDRLPEGETEEQWRERNKLRLRVEDILVADDENTKFGSLPASSLDGFISAKDADIRDLAAVTQTPPNHLLGEMVNLSAEALAAAEAGRSRKSDERKHSFGESWEQALRLGAAIMGDEGGARDTEAQVRWKDVESRSLAQVADALGKLAQSLGLPPQMLWERIPDWTQQDTDRAERLLKEGDSVAALMQALTDGQTSTEDTGGGNN
jgi:hypothetical protein